jgi:hypothetical protein
MALMPSSASACDSASPKPMPRAAPASARSGDDYRLPAHHRPT